MLEIASYGIDRGTSARHLKADSAKLGAQDNAALDIPAPVG